MFILGSVAAVSGTSTGSGTTTGSGTAPGWDAIVPGNGGFRNRVYKRQFGWFLGATNGW